MSSRMLLIGLASFCCTDLQTADASGQTCNSSEPPTEACTAPRVISGTPGQHVVLMDVLNATGQSTLGCGVPIGNEVWFEVTPTVSGLMTISTCHPNTTYDTALEVFKGGDFMCDFMSSVACNDDATDAACAVACTTTSGRASKATINVTAGTRYRFVVGSWGNNTAGCTTCLGVIVTIDGTCGDPPTNFVCGAARQLSGAAGIQEVFIDAGDMPSFPEVWDPSCTSATSVGSNLWFTFNAAVKGLARFSTCNPNTSYDTVARAMTGTCGGQMVEVDCNDDTDSSACLNSCSLLPRGSSLTFPIEQGNGYYLEVGSFNDNNAACPQCLDATLEIFDCTGVSPPVAVIATPTDFGCQCNGGNIVGSAFQNNSPFAQYTLEYQPANSSTRTLISTASTPVVNGVLGTWNTSALADGWYFLHLTAESLCGQVSTDTKIVRVGSGVDTVRLDSPTNGAILGGTVCFDGTAWDQSCFDHYAVDFRPAGSTGPFSPVDPTQPTYPSTRVNQALATWDTIAVPDGDYEVRLKAADVCSNVVQVVSTITVDNTPPTAVIANPAPCDYVGGVLNIMGTALDANIESWVLQYAGGSGLSWTTIASSNTNQNGLLGLWDTSTLPLCAYALRLIVTDKARLSCNGAIPHRSEHTVTVNVGFCGDFDADNDNDVDLRDFGAFLDAFTGP